MRSTAAALLLALASLLPAAPARAQFDVQPQQLPAFTGDTTTTKGINGNVTTTTKTNGVSFGTAATKDTGTSGATVPLLSGANVWTGSEDFTGSAVTVAAPSAANSPVTKTYADAIAAGLSVRDSVVVATATFLSNTPAYLNGSSGVGATLTGVGFAALVVDGVTVSVGDRVLVKNQASALTNGIYTVTATGSGGAVYILTRATDYDQSAEIYSGTYTLALNGTVNADLSFAMTTTGVVTVGSTAINWTQINLSAVTSVAGKTGTVTLQCADITDHAASCSVDATNASNLASGTLPAARLPVPTASTLGGVESLAAASHNFLTSISTSGVPARAQPACADISDAAASCATDATNANNIGAGTLPAGRFPALTGDVTTSAGALATTLKNTGAGAGSCVYCSVTFDAQGRETTYSGPTAATPYHLAGGTAASTNSTSVKGSAGTLYYISGISTSATLAYLRIYDSASAPTCSSATNAKHSYPIAASATGAGFAIEFPNGEAYANGIGFCVTGGGSDTDNTNAPTGIYINGGYN